VEILAYFPVTDKSTLLVSHQNDLKELSDTEQHHGNTCLDPAASFIHGNANAYLAPKSQKFQKMKTQHAIT